jgi:hypothetical protein
MRSIHVEIGIRFTEKTLVKSHDKKNLNLFKPKTTNKPTNRGSSL